MASKSTMIKEKIFDEHPAAGNDAALVAIMIPLFKMFSAWKLVNTWIALALPSISTPFLIMMFRQAARSFPHDIIEASRLEGLSEIKIFFTMFLPIMKSTYGAAMTVTFMNAWNNYLWPTIILQDKIRLRCRCWLPI